HRAFYRTRDANFTIHGLLGFDLVGKYVGIIGTGKIGRLVAEILRGFGMEVLAYDVKPDQDWATGIGAQYVDLPQIYSDCRVISLHCPLTPQTHHLIDAAALEAMGEDAVLINTGRGGLVDTAALVEVLRTSAIGGAALDVYEEESQYFFEDFSSQVISDDILARLIGFPNVLITSHQGFFTAEALEAIARTTLGNVDAYFADAALDNEVCYRCDGPCDKGDRGRCF
ncbi:MAG: NAD(P)-dependent oxidoreductase, partial [Planctomycetota bacterium]